MADIAVLEVRELAASGSPSDYLELPYEQRQKSRLKASLSSGREVAIFLPRGTRLRHSTLLGTTSGQVIEVRASMEDVSVVRTDDPTRLARLAYHLGNRHVPLEVSAGYVRYRHDPVLDEMIRHLGGDVARESARFEPEAGAYDQVSGGHEAG